MKVLAGDGYKGWPEHAPFDSVIVTCAPDLIPQALIDQLHDGGRMIIPVGTPGEQQLYLLQKHGAKIEQQAVLPVGFQSPKLTNYSPKGTAVVSTSIANNESYGCVGSGVGRISYASCEFTGKHYGYHDRDHYDHDRYLPRRSDGHNYRSDRPSIDVHF